MPSELVKELIQDAQDKLIQAIGYLEDAKKAASDSWDFNTEQKLEVEWRAVNEIDNRLGKIKQRKY